MLLRSKRGGSDAGTASQGALAAAELRQELQGQVGLVRQDLQAQRGLSLIHI